MTYMDRLKLEVLLKSKIKVCEIAKLLGFNTSTIYREIKKGAYIHTNSDLSEENRYSPELSYAKYKEHLKNKGGDLKIGKDYALASFLENTIEEKHYSPGAALALAKSEKKKFSVEITRQTVYSYINKGILLIKKEWLPLQGKRRKKKENKPIQKRVFKGTSIEKRHKDVKYRKEFGHWEMDTVVGKRNGSLKTLLVLTERKTRKEIIILLPDRTTNSVVSALHRLERKWGSKFKHLFKTITVDNGVEFSDTKGIEKSILNKKEKRTLLYYCHAYSSYERGTNENNNRFIRRVFPKGTDFKHLTRKAVQKLEDWMNDYPREILGWHSARELFEIECQQILS